MDLGLKGKVALATASSEGIGRAVAEALAAEGADLVICARREAPLEEARQALEQYGGEVLAVPADLTDPLAVKEVVGAAFSAFGRVDVLVTNTGAAGPMQSRRHILIMEIDLNKEGPPQEPVLRNWRPAKD